MEVTTTGALAVQNGIKCIIYGSPGSGKTPLALTASNSLYIAIERGQISLQGSNAPAVEAYDLESFYKVLEWIVTTPEGQLYDTYFFDSISQLSLLVLDQELNKKAKSGEKVNGQAAYGAMARRVLTSIDILYNLPNKNIVLLSQLNTKPEQARPYFPGNEIDTRIPHKFDCVFHLGIHEVPEHGPTYSLLCRETDSTFARCRFENCANVEAANLDYLFNKLTNGV